MLKLETIGNIGNDAEIKKFNQNEFVCFNVAAQVKKKDASGQYVKDTQWVSVYWYGNGGALFQYLKKGTKVCRAGSLAGIVKEWWDSKGHGKVEEMDAIFTLIGAVCAIPFSILFHFLIW